MTAEQWNAYGYEVVEDEKSIYLIRVLLDVGYVTPAENGEWTKYENVNRLRWRFIDPRNYPRIIEKVREKSFNKCA